MQVFVNVNNIFQIVVMTIVMCLTTENTKSIILLILTNETLDLVIFPLDTGYGFRNVIMIYQLFVKKIM